MNIKRKYFYSIICVFLATLMIVLSMSLPVGALSLSAANSQDKIDATLKEKMATASPDEKIPVAIWYEDVDQNKIDTLTAKEVGFSEEEIDVDYEMPSTELLTSLKAEEAGAVDEMQAYLHRTEIQREKERKRTDEYIMTRRAFSREKYNEKSAKIVKDIDLEENDIVFKSQYAPMIIVELTKSQIEVYSKSKSVTNIYIAEEETVVADDDSNTIFGNVNIAQNTIKHTYTVENLRTSESELNGDEVVIGVAEAGGMLQECDELKNSLVSSLDGVTLYQNNKMHATNVIRLIVGEDSGFAKGASVITANATKNHIETLLDPEHHVSIINMSFSQGTALNYGNTCKWYDHLVAQHGVTIIASACNNDSQLRLYAPGLAYNVIMVGAYYLGSSSTSYTADISDDKMTKYTGYINTGCAEKPDVVMPSEATSYATPILTSCVALMLQLKPSLAAYPQAIKAIVLASSHRKVLSSANGEASESIYSGITDHQGVGAPNVWTMMCIVSQGTYGIGILDSSINEASLRFVNPNYESTSMNISLTWLINTSFESNESHTNENLIGDVNITDLNMSVYRNNAFLKSSCLTNSSTEMTYFDLVSNQINYEVKINKNSNTTEDIRYGYAYSTDNAYMTPITSEGVYRIKNLETGTYLTLDSSTNELNLSSYLDSSLQEWIVKKNNAFQISSAHEKTTGIINRSNMILDASNNKAVLGCDTLNFSMTPWENLSVDGNRGGVVLYSYIGATPMYLDHFNNYVSLVSNTPNTTNSNYWILEKVNFRRGDANADGEYQENDATLVQMYVANLSELNNLQMFLADANYDGYVNVKDATRISSIIDNALIY